MAIQGSPSAEKRGGTLPAVERGRCRKCDIEIGGHNIYLHDGMCDDCFFREFPAR